jgi:menaquinone-dependent protoporphyrinogen IX oxidase
MKGIIIYKGKYGATHQYTEWIGSTLRLPAIIADHITGESLSKYDFVVIGSSVYMGRLLIKDWLKQNLASIQNMKIFLFIVCGTAPGEIDKLKKIARENIPEVIRNKCDVYFLHGRMIKKNLTWSDRFMLKVGALLTRDPVERKNMLQDFNAVKGENILPLLEAINTYSLSSDRNCLISNYSMYDG